MLFRLQTNHKTFPRVLTPNCTDKRNDNFILGLLASTEEHLQQLTNALLYFSGFFHTCWKKSIILCSPKTLHHLLISTVSRHLERSSETTVMQGFWLVLHTLTFAKIESKVPKKLSTAISIDYRLIIGRQSADKRSIIGRGSNRTSAEYRSLVKSN